MTNCVTWLEGLTGALRFLLDGSADEDLGEGGCRVRLGGDAVGVGGYEWTLAELDAASSSCKVN